MKSSKSRILLFHHLAALTINIRLESPFTPQVFIPHIRSLLLDLLLRSLPILYKSILYGSLTPLPLLATHSFQHHRLKRMLLLDVCLLRQSHFSNFAHFFLLFVLHSVVKGLLLFAILFEESILVLLNLDFGIVKAIENAV